MRIKIKKKFVARILELVVVLISFIATPFAIDYATKLRGYEAMGSEYLLPILGLIIAMVIETIYQDSKGSGKHGKKGL